MRDFSFENLLTSYRTRVGWTQPTVAEALEVSLRTYQGWENGERLPPNTMLQRIANLFELTEDEADRFYHAAAQVAPELQNLPFPRNPFFTGRETYLEQLVHALFESGAVAITQPISISGLGGIGKTQLALEYAHRCHPQVYRTVLWANAASKVTLEKSYLSLAHLLKLPQQDECEVERVVQAVKTWLGGHVNWLLILDNADDLQLARTFLPAKPRGHVLLTTRSQIVGSIAVPIVLEAMEPEEGQRFLLQRSGLVKPGTATETLAPAILEAVTQLVELLGGHPLALDQAGAYIEETGASFNTYIQLYHEQRRILLDKRGSLGDEHPETVVVTFEVSFRRACEVCPPAADVLSFCAFLSPDAIPEELFSHNESLKLHPLMFYEAMGALRRFSLIKRNAQDKLLSVHRLVQAVLQDRMDRENFRAWAERAVHGVSAIFPEVDYPTWKQCERLVPQALVCASHIVPWEQSNLDLASLLLKTAAYMYERGQYAETEPLFQRALHIREQELFPEHPDLASPLYSLGNLYRRQGKYAEAEQFYQRALHIFEQSLGPDHLQVAHPLTGLAELYRVQGQYAEAEPLYQRALHIFEQSLGLDHLQEAHPLTGLANLYSEQGRYAEAEPLFQRALRIWEQSLGPAHPQVAKLLNNLATFYSWQGNYAKAEPLYQRALHTFEQSLGPEYVEVAHPLNNLAELYSKQGQYAKAEPLYQRALRIWEQSLGPAHPQVAHPLNNLAILYCEQGQFAKAEPLFQRALTLRERARGAQHPETAESLHDFAACQQTQGDSEEARTLYTRALAIREQALGAQHPKTTETRTHLIALLHAMGQYEEAAQLEAAQPERGTKEEERETH